MKGKIIITDKVYFEPDGLSIPSAYDYAASSYSLDEAVKAYEASKRLVEVEGAEKYDELYSACISLDGMFEDLDNNQPCTASIKDNKATIISLNK